MNGIHGGITLGHKASLLLRVAAAVTFCTSGLLARGAPTAMAASSSVVGYAATVTCNSLGSTLTIRPYGSGTQNGIAQTIYYRYWILNRGTGQWVKNFNPTGWGSFGFQSPKSIYIDGAGWTTSTTNFSYGIEETFSLPHGQYSVLTEYWTYGSVWTTSYTAFGLPVYGACRI